MGRVGSGWPRGEKKINLRSKDDVWTVVLSESPWTANRRSRKPVIFFLYFLVRKNSSYYRDSNSRPNGSEGYEVVTN